MLRCVVADDHPAVLVAVSHYLETNGISVVARCRSGEEALEAVLANEPEIALLDLRMDGRSGVDVTRDVVRSGVATSVVVYSGYGEPDRVLEALDAGASGFVLKEAALPELLRALQIVAAGGTYVDAVAAGAFALVAADKDKLSRREREVLRLLADGFSNEEVGRRLFISSETVRTHVRKAMRKLGAATRTQAVAIALRQALIA